MFGWNDINFKKITSIRSNKELMTEELNVLLEDLEDILDQRGIDEKAIYLNPDFDDDNETVYQSKNDDKVLESWRKSIPAVIKMAIPWESYSLDLVELFSNEILQCTKGKENKEVKRFLEELKSMKASADRKMDNLIEKQKTLSIEDQAIISIEDWKINIPEIVKHHVLDWKTITIDDLLLVLSDLVKESKGLAKELFEDYFCELEDLKLEIEEAKDDQFLYDPLEIIAKYRDGAIKEEEKDKALQDDYWRKMVPLILKYQIKDWKTSPIREVYDKAKEILRSSSGSDREIILEFVTEMSQIIFDHVEDDEEMDQEEAVDSHDEIADYIMSLVEMIILPRLEALDIIQTRGGNVKIANLGEKSFLESLIVKVKDRDHWKCIICKSETELHVHHIIPGNLGGIHHMDNLVTLCSSCHAAIETADTNHAFSKCLANYKRKKFTRGKKFEDLSKDKKLLKEEVENSLDMLLNELNKKDELKLMEDVIGIMKRLEIIFYE